MPALALAQRQTNTASLYQLLSIPSGRTETGIPIQIVTADLTGLPSIRGIVDFDTEPTIYVFSPSSFSQSYLLDETEPELTYDILRPIPVVVEQNDDYFVASFTDANIHASGETALEALDNLKSYVGDVLEEFLGIGSERLGPGPARELAVLEQYVQERH